MDEIWLHVAGRLGNRLFQLAAAHQLASRYGARICYFSDSFHGNSHYDELFTSFMRACSHVEGIYKSDLRGRFLQISDFLYARNSNLFDLVNRRLKVTRSMNAFDSPTFTNQVPRLVTGFFINSQSVLNAGNFTEELSSYVQKIEIRQEINMENDYQVVHVRGTDFKGNVYGSLSQLYYASLPLKHSPTYVVTDDIDHAKAVTRGINVISYFGPGELDPWQSLALMSRSKTLYTSNSALSWWGGYLGAIYGNEIFLPAPFYRENEAADRALFVRRFNYLPAKFDQIRI